MNVATVLLSTALVVVGGISIHLSRQIDAGRRQIASRELQLPGPPDSRLVEPAPGLPAAAALPLVGLTEDEVASAQGATTRRLPAESLAYMDVVREQMRSPESIARRRQSTLGVVAASHPDIAEAIELTPEEVDRLHALLADQQERSMNVVRNSDITGTDGTPIAQTLQEEKQSRDAELQALLGSRYPRWQDYEQTLPVWQQRRDLRAVLNAAGAPMTNAQERALIEALSAEQRVYNPAPETAFRQHTPERHERLLAAAASALNQVQVENYRQMLDRAVAQEQAMSAMFLPVMPAPAKP